MNRNVQCCSSNLISSMPRREGSGTVAHEIIEVAADYSRRSTVWARLCPGHESKTSRNQTATIAPSAKMSADAVTDLASRESTILDKGSTVKMMPHASCQSDFTWI